MKNNQLITSTHLKYLIWVCSGILLISVSGRFTWNIEFGIVNIPITLQSLVIISTNLLFPRWLGLFSTILWLILATFGMPLLANGQGGIDWIENKTTGYLLGFVLVAFILNSIRLESRSNYSFKVIIALQFISTFIIILLGWIVLSVHIDTASAFYYGVNPFLYGAFIKILLGSLIVYYCFRFFQPN